VERSVSLLAARQLFSKAGHSASLPEELQASRRAAPSNSIPEPADREPPQHIAAADFLIAQFRNFSRLAGVRKKHRMLQ
jgi:hypothetical protein